MTDGRTREADQETADQVPYTFDYDHGRMPLFMKIVWVGFLIFATWYVVSFLLTSLAEEIGG